MSDCKVAFPSFRHRANNHSPPQLSSAISEDAPDSEAFGFPPSTPLASSHGTDDHGFDLPSNFVGASGPVVAWSPQARAANLSHEQFRGLLYLQDNMMQLGSPVGRPMAITPGTRYAESNSNQDLFDLTVGDQTWPYENLGQWMVDTPGPSTAPHPQPCRWRRPNPNNPGAWVFNTAIPDEFLMPGSTRWVSNITWLKPMPYCGEYVPADEEFINVTNPWNSPLVRGPYWQAFLGDRLIPSSPSVTIFKHPPPKAKNVGTWNYARFTSEAREAGGRYLGYQLLMEGVFIPNSEATRLAVSALRLCEESFGFPPDKEDSVGTSTQLELLGVLHDFVKLTSKEIFLQTYFNFGIGAPGINMLIDGSNLIAQKISNIGSNHFWCHRHVRTMAGLIKAKFVDNRIDITIAKLMLAMPESTMIWFAHHPLTTSGNLKLPYPLIAFVINFLEWGCGQVNQHTSKSYFSDMWTKRQPAVLQGERRKIDASGGGYAMASQPSLEEELHDVLTQGGWWEMHQARFFSLFKQIQALYLVG
ncbi:hypothetical protein BDN67DRAFT_1015035 [Paxillus ammoniavirescens]|nr:hypothetical protein BDN67DRAFT_1015035 [Paxillus ammoniavirescens]